MKKYVFDLDNTLIYTDSLNNDSYNYALGCKGLHPIEGFDRLTRDIVFEQYPDIDEVNKREVVDLKSDYFKDNVHNTSLNEPIVELLKSQVRDDCILWTSCNEARAKFLLEHYKLDGLFKEILFSSKTDVVNDISKICKIHDCKAEHLLIYDDNRWLIEELEKLNLKAILV